MQQMIKCRETGKCFAQTVGANGKTFCDLLERSYEPGTCPFMKADKEKTGKAYYPKVYGKRKAAG